MNDDFYASIKLVSGEELFAITSSENDTLIVQDPVCIETIHGPRGSFVRIEPWMHVPNDQFYFIDKTQIILLTLLKIGWVSIQDQPVKSNHQKKWDI